MMPFHLPPCPGKRSSRRVLRTIAAKGLKGLVNRTGLHVFDVNIGTLGNAITGLSHLLAKGIIDDDQYGCLFNSLRVLADMRRNIDAHTFYGITVGGSINGDLESLYLPAVNLMLQL
jgi:hypothetical protein